MRSLLLLILLIPLFPAYAQQGKATVSNTYRFFEVTDGLPQMRIWSLTEDSHGFIWVCTKDGLARWDGTGFRIWNSRMPGFGPAHAQQLLQTADDEYIAITGATARWMKGSRIMKLALPDTVTSVAHVFRLNDSEVIFANCEFRNIPCDLSICHHLVFNTRVKKIQRTLTTKGMLQCVLNSGYIVSAQRKLKLGTFHCNFYLYSVDNIFRDSTTGFDDIPVPTDDRKQYEPWATLLLKNSSVLPQLPTLKVLSEHDGRLVRQPLKPRKPIALSRSSDEVAFVYVNDTSYYYIDTARYVHFVKGDVDEIYVKVGVVTSATADHNGNLWLGTEHGLYCFYGSAFRRYEFNVPEGEGAEIWSIARARNGLYYLAFYKNGIYEYNDRTGAFRKLKLTTGNKALDAQYQVYLNCGTFCATRLWGDNVLLPLLHSFAVKNDQLTKTYIAADGDAETYAVAADTVHKCAYVSQHHHLFRINTDLSLDTLCRDTAAGLRTITSCVLDKNGDLLLGGNASGPNIIKYKNGVFSPLFKCGRTPMSMCTDHIGNVWIAAADTFYCYDNRSLRAVPISTNSLFTSVKAYSKKWLLIGTNKELILMDLEAYYAQGRIVCYYYDHTNGFNTVNCSQNSMLIDDDGSVWIPTAQALIRCRPDELTKVSKPPAPVIDDICFSGNDLNWQADTNISATSITSLHYRRNLQVGFKAAAVDGASRVLYRYRLTGSNSNWSSPTTNPIAIFNNLRPGSYRFEAEASLDGVNWSAATTSRTILFPYRLTERPPFIAGEIILALLIVVGATALTLKMRHKNRNRLQEQQLQMLLLKLQSIRSKAVPHFIGNAFNNVDFLIGQQQYDDASRYVALLSRLYSHILLNANKPDQSLEEELQLVKHYLQLEKLRFKDKLNYGIDIAGPVRTDARIPNMVIYTYVENAIKHGLGHKTGEGHVSINVTENNEGLWISVADDGIGREAAARYKTSTGVGLSILAQQIEIYNERNTNKIKQEVEDLCDADGRSSGTVFRIFIPHHYNYDL